MKRGSFIFDGVPSENVKAIIQGRPVIEAPLRKVEWKSPFGSDGDTPFDEGAYNNTTLDLIMMTDGTDAVADRQKVYNLLDTRGKYKDFIPYFDPKKIYRVQLMDKSAFESPYHFREKQSFTVKFTVKPYKYLVDSPTKTFTNTGGTIINPTFYDSLPIIKITGTGSVVLKVNNFSYSITNVQPHIVLNTERMIAYQDDNGVLTNRNDRVSFKEYPVLRPGNNTISVTGSVTQIQIQPRWRSLL